MSDVDEVWFPYAAAAELAAELRSAARVADWQTGERAREGDQAKQEWRGAYRDRFDETLAKIVGDGSRLANELRRAANQLDEATDQARREQARRDGRPYIPSHRPP